MEVVFCDTGKESFINMSSFVISPSLNLYRMNSAPYSLLQFSKTNCFKGYMEMGPNTFVVRL